MERFCQSCGMLLRNQQGSNEDGSLNQEYCLNCWKDGAFLQAEIQTGKEMQEFVYNLLRKNYKTNPLIAWFFTKNIPKLKRWDKK